VDVDWQTPPDAGVNASLTLCSSDPATPLFSQLGGTPDPGGNWLNPFGGFSNGQFDPANSAVGLYQYVVNATSLCPSDTAQVLTNVVAAPVGGVTTTLDFCSVDPITDLFPLIVGTPDAGGAWTDPLGNPFTGILDPAVDPSGAYTYTLTGISPCIDISTTVNVSIVILPDAGADGLLSICEDEPALPLLTVLGGTPLTTGIWLDASGNLFSGTFDPVVDPTGVYTYVVPGSLICPSDTSIVSVTVDTLPFAGTNAALALCANEPQNNLFPLIAPADLGGAWSLNGGAQPGTIDPSQDVSGDYLYILAGTGACASRTDTAIVETVISPLPIVLFSADTLESCSPLQVQFINQTSPLFLTGSCSWDFGDGSTNSSCGPVSNTYQNPGSYDVSLVVTTDAGCIDSLVQPGLIKTYPPPSADFVMGPNPTSVESQQVTLEAIDPIATQWNWSVPTLGDTSGTPYLQYTFDSYFGDEYEICLNVRDQFGCQDLQCQTLLVNGPLWVYVPNAFTPNGDGINDSFFPVIDGDDGEIHDFRIFDRWGNPVFESGDKNIVWLGSKDNSGDVLPQGVYVWRLVTRGWGQAENKEYMGHVTLIR
jgi:gliding motility-associated-like protein